MGAKMPLVSHKTKPELNTQEAKADIDSKKVEEDIKTDKPSTEESDLNFIMKV